MRSLVSIVVLNWNGLDFLPSCLEGALSQTYSPVEIIIVDNGSSDESLSFIRTEYPHLRLVCNDSNLGFSLGMNCGFDHASGRYVMALNMDVCLKPDCVERLVDALEADPSLGAIMGKELTWDDDGFKDIPSISAGPIFLRRRCQGGTDRTRIDNRTNSFGAMGSFPIFRVECLEGLKRQVGYIYDPKFGTGWEDMDVFFRLHHLGYQFLYEPSGTGYHYGSGSVGGRMRLLDKSHDYQVRIFRNRYFLILKNYPTWLLVRHLIFLVLAEIATLFYLLAKRPSSLRALAQGQVLTLRSLAPILHDRRLILSRSNQEKNDLLAFFRGF